MVGFLDEAHGLIDEFNEAFGVEATPELQLSLVTEEANELATAFMHFTTDETVENASAVLKELADFMYVTLGLVPVERRYTHDVVLKAALADATFQEARQVGQAMLAVLTNAVSPILGDEFWLKCLRAVHQSNMSKLGDDGEVLRNEAGKVMKGPHYKPADMTELAKEFLAALEA